MLPLSDLRVIPADKVEPGMLAYLERHNVLFAVGMRNGAPTAVLFDGKLEYATLAVDDLPGNATVINGWRIEADHASLGDLNEMDNRHLSLMVRDEKAVLYAVEARMRIPVMFLEMPGSIPTGSLAFQNWRIVHVETEEVIFERK